MWTYKRNHASYDFGNSAQATSSHNFMIWKFLTQSEVTKSKQINVLMVLVISLGTNRSAMQDSQSGQARELYAITVM
jgi:hypothetical protein